MKYEELSEDELRNLLKQRLKELATHFKPSISESELSSFISANMNMINDEIALWERTSSSFRRQT